MFNATSQTLHNEENLLIGLLAWFNQLNVSLHHEELAIANNANCAEEWRFVGQSDLAWKRALVVSACCAGHVRAEVAFYILLFLLLAAEARGLFRLGFCKPKAGEFSFFIRSLQAENGIFGVEAVLKAVDEDDSALVHCLSILLVVGFLFLKEFAQDFARC